MGHMIAVRHWERLRCLVAGSVLVGRVLWGMCKVGLMGGWSSVVGWADVFFLRSHGIVYWGVGMCCTQEN